MIATILIVASVLCQDDGMVVRRRPEDVLRGAGLVLDRYTFVDAELMRRAPEIRKEQEGARSRVEERAAGEDGPRFEAEQRRLKQARQAAGAPYEAQIAILRRQAATRYERLWRRPEIREALREMNRRGDLHGEWRYTIGPPEDYSRNVLRDLVAILKEEDLVMDRTRAYPADETRFRNEVAAADVLHRQIDAGGPAPKPGADTQRFDAEAARRNLEGEVRRLRAEDDRIRQRVRTLERDIEIAIVVRQLSHYRKLKTPGSVGHSPAFLKASERLDAIAEAMNVP